MKLKVFFFLTIISLFSVLSAIELGPNVSTYDGKELKWENGSYKHFILFQEVLSPSGECPEDKEFNEKTFYFSEVPLGIDLQKAFLIWTSFQLPSEINEPTDNSVTLNFHTAGYNYSETVETSQAYSISQTQGFEFDSVISNVDPSRSYYTYRVDVTDFIDGILQRREENGGTSGTFYIKDLSCNYVPEIYPTGKEVGSWAILMVYEEPQSLNNSVYIYDGIFELENGREDLNTENINCDAVSRNDKCILLTDSGAKNINAAEKSWMISNLLVKSFTPRKPDFNIPNKKELVLCSPAKEHSDRWCEGGLEHHFSIKIKNVGPVSAKNVFLAVDIPPELEYVSGSAKYSDNIYSVNGQDIASNWTAIPDAENGSFPLSEKFKISDWMIPSDIPEDELILVNFKVKIIDEADVNDFKVKAIISSNNDTIYKTVYSAELDIEREEELNCYDYTEELDLTPCGEKTHINQCFGDYQCYTGQHCCIFRTQNYGFCSNLECNKPIPVCGASFEVNKYNEEYYGLSNDDLKYITLQDDLVFFDFSLESSYSCALVNQVFEFKFETSDSNISLENARWYQNAPNSYIFEPEKDIIIGKTELYENSIRFYFPFFFKMGDSYSKERYFFVADIKYKKEKVSKNAYFSIAIDDSGMIFDKNAPLVIEGLPIISNFHIGHSESVIFTSKNQGSYHYYDLNIETTSIDKNNKITAIYVKISDKSILNLSGKSPSFTLYTDSNSDGKGDTFIASADKSKDGIYKIETDINLYNNKWKTLILTGKVNLEDGESIIIEVPEIELEHETDILGLPLTSREYHYWEDEDSHQIQCGCSLTFVN